MTWLAVVLAVLGAVSVTVGVGLVSVPAALMVAGLLSVVAAYVVAYVEAQR